MENIHGELVDLFVPRKCAATGRLIEAKDHASVQIAIAEVDDNGKIIPGQTKNVPISGTVRHQAESDDSLNRILQEQGLRS
ncbi:40S ribosomal protein S21 [Malassezia cuniculi]|uniref:40S ribosomal protein S21 n=1 Tax=Malassezia cuniculi TaxID=948313 RepID=A0AAF0J807_9BASI|nr:40S ribosomal protein S21 [Malassezia cuniculi]